jgi:hypothetical protein
MWYTSHSYSSGSCPEESAEECVDLYWTTVGWGVEEEEEEEEALFIMSAKRGKEEVRRRFELICSGCLFL